MKLFCMFNNLMSGLTKCTIYILQCENDKYYIGKTYGDIDQRIKQHFDGNGSSWTKLNKPLKVVARYLDCNSFDEDKYVKQYMSLYGINNVRGGSYSRMNLSLNSIQIIEREINGANNKCFNCGSEEHFVSDCINNKCKRCFRIGHTPMACTYKIDYNGTYIGRKCARCGRDSHSITNCYARSHVHTSKKLSDETLCFRCGKPDHWKITCTEKVDINGFNLKPHPIGHIGKYLKSFL